LQNGYNRANPLRIESEQDAKAIDERIARMWEGHPRRFVVDACPNFLEKARRALDILRAEMAECCRGHLVAMPASVGETVHDSLAGNESQKSNSAEFVLRG
jgi:hypothetical protein